MNMTHDKYIPHITLLLVAFPLTEELTPGARKPENCSQIMIHWLSLCVLSGCRGQADRRAGHKQDVLPVALGGPRGICISANPRPQACIRTQHYEELNLLRPQKRVLDAFQEDVHMMFRRQAKG